MFDIISLVTTPMKSDLQLARPRQRPVDVGVPGSTRHDRLARSQVAKCACLPGRLHVGPLRVCRLVLHVGHNLAGGDDGVCGAESKKFRIKVLKIERVPLLSVDQG